ncbi:MAG TPA: hypothetical protein VJN70_15560 [Gemmatimonadaceae bacterium]|nr:hypothetical protein [Gemmatimonadaceae bacterium]
MSKIVHRSRWAAAVVAVSVLVLIPGCSNWKDQLLSPQNPGLIDQGAVGSAAAATALKVGAIGKLRTLLNCSSGECMWEEAGNLADEFKNSDFQPDRQDIDQRTMTTANAILSGTGGFYAVSTQIRGYIKDAITAEHKYNAQNKADIGELWLALAFVEMQLAEDFCNGIPLGSNTNGVVDYSSAEFTPLTNLQVYDLALKHVDSALAVVGPGTDSTSLLTIRQAALITRARILVDEGGAANVAAAAALVPSSAVPSNYQYDFLSSPSSNADDNGLWILNISVSRITVSDSVDVFGGVTYTTANALPFASANDPRVPVLSGSQATPTVAAEDGTTPMFIEQIWKNRDDPVPMVSGIDARLIEAEARLVATDLAGMTTILNALRTTPPAIGTFTPAAMGSLATPADQNSAVSLFFREKAFWTFGRGQRLGDLRRLIRQYGRTDDQVFPTGTYFKGGQPYGHDVNFPVPDVERVNPQFKGCIDRNA